MTTIDKIVPGRDEVLVTAAAYQDRPCTLTELCYSVASGRGVRVHSAQQSRDAVDQRALRMLVEQLTASGDLVAKTGQQWKLSRIVFYNQLPTTTYYGTHDGVTRWLAAAAAKADAARLATAEQAALTQLRDLHAAEYARLVADFKTKLDATAAAGEVPG